MLRAGLGVALLWSFAASASAQPQGAPWDHPELDCQQANVSLVNPGWMLYPVIKNATVVGVFAQLEDPYNKPHKNNVGVLWSTPDAEGNWDLYGWKNHDEIEAANYLRLLLGDKEVLPEIPTGSGFSFQIPEPMPHGLMVSDPFAAALAQNPTPALLTTLIDLGAAGAPFVSGLLLGAAGNQNGTGDMCVLDEVMNYAALGMSESLNTALSTMAQNSFTQTFGGSIVYAASASIQADIWFRWCNFGPWDPYECTGSEMTAGGCKFTGCTRSRLVIYTYPFGFQSEEIRIDSPECVTVSQLPDGTCPDDPN